MSIKFQGLHMNSKSLMHYYLNSTTTKYFISSYQFCINIVRLLYVITYNKYLIQVHTLIFNSYPSTITLYVYNSFRKYMHSSSILNNCLDFSHFLMQILYSILTNAFEWYESRVCRV